MSQRGMADRSISRAVGQRLYAMRKYRQWSRAQVAVRAGVSEQTVARYETGQSPITIDCLVLIADALQVDIGRLIYPEQKRYAS